jgi:predicted nucleic acid-binding protein
MSGVFVDTNILICSEDGAHPPKRDIALQWLAVLWQRGIGRTSTQVLSDFYVSATRKLTPPMAAGDARAEVRRFELWQPWHIDHATVESAWAVESRYGLPFGDSLVIASAQHLGCSFVISEDLEHEALYGAVQIINPFKASLAILDTVQ